MIPILDSKRQYATIGTEVEKAVCEVLRSGSYILGPNTKAFEQEMADFYGCKYTVGLNSGTDALHLALRALNIGAGDEVITVAFTFVATTEAIGIVGAKPVFVDIDENTFDLDASKLEAAITPKTKAIIPVHLYGQPCDMDAIMAVAKKHNLHVIEDCCQAVGALYKGKMVGTFGDFGCLSFYPTKNLGGMGDGGLIMTNDEKLRDRVVALRNHGGAVRYHHDEIGVNSRLDEIQAAILRVKLPHLEEWTEKRRKAAAWYAEGLEGVPVVLPPTPPAGYEQSYYVYTIRAEKRDELQAYLKANNIGCAVYYPVPLYKQPAYKDRGFKAEDYPEAEKAAKEVLSIPMFPEITEEQVRRVCETIRAFYEKDSTI